TRPLAEAAVYSLRCFFFSSRRRHTRSKRDWSSDVCSSDLSKSNSGGPHRLPLRRSLGRNRLPARSRSPRPLPRRRVPLRHNEQRSEERRVGKECRSRWGTEQSKKKERKAKGA